MGTNLTRILALWCSVSVSRVDFVSSNVQLRNLVNGKLDHLRIIVVTQKKLKHQRVSVKGDFH